MRHTPPIRLLLIDDHYVVRMGIAAVLGLEKDFAIAGEAEDAASALALYRSNPPDVTLLDLRMPGAGGLEILRQIRAEFPGARVIVLTSSDLEEDVFRSMDAGAAGYLLKTASREEMASAVRTVHAGLRAISPEAKSRLSEHARRRALSPREVEVLDYVRRGLSNRDIAIAMGVTEHTAKAHVKAILSKLDAADRTEAVAIAFGIGLLKVESE